MSRYNDPSATLGEKYAAALREIDHLQETIRNLRKRRQNLRIQVKQQDKCIAQYRNLCDKLYVKATGNEPVSNREKRELAKQVVG